MNGPYFHGICLISPDVLRLAGFYADLLRSEVVGDGGFAVVPTDGAHLTFFSVSGLNRMQPGSVGGMGTGASTLELLVDDVDACHARLAPTVPVVKPPTTQPWGRRSVWIRDPDGNFVNLFQSTTGRREPADLVREYLTRLLIERDISVCDELLADDYIDTDAPPGTRPGPQATREYVGSLLAEHTDLGFSIHGLLASENTVAVHAIWRALDQAGLLLITVAEQRLRTRRSTYWRLAGTT